MARKTFQWWMGRRCACVYFGIPARNTAAKVNPGAAASTRGSCMGPSSGWVTEGSELDQIQRAFQQRPSFLPQMQVFGGGGQIAVSQQPLQHRQLHAGFQQMGGKTMPQRMNALMIGQLGQADGPVENELRRIAGQGRTGIVRRGKQPQGRTHQPPIGAQFCQQPGR